MELFIPHLPQPATSLALALVASSNAPLLLLDHQQKVVGAIRTFCSAFGIDPKHIEGVELAKLGGGEWDVPQLRSLLKATFAGDAAVEAYEMDLIRPGHKTACLILNAHKLNYDEDKPLVILTVTDITAARRSEKLKDALVQEKQVLLQELQHRVANSLQIIASVLMQSARRVQSEETRVHLHNAHNRVMSIATLQKQLAVASDDKVELRKYFNDLCASIGASMIDDEDRVKLAATTDDSSVTANVSVSLGLIVTELAINSLKHAFPGRKQTGTIKVDYRSEGKGFKLTVTDDGVGIAAGQGQGKPGLGTGIVDALAKQLGATVETTDQAPGTKVSVVLAA
ncbi:MAG: histidine kinase dimerization/phosphoacceptor domain -containing protein [Sphingomicrobium sp.]